MKVEVDLWDWDLGGDSLSVLDWDGIGGWEMGSLGDLFMLYKFLESNRFFVETKTGGIPCLHKASFTIDKYASGFAIP